MMTGEFHGGQQNPYWRPPTLTEIVVEGILRGVAWVITTIWSFRYLTITAATWTSTVVYVDRRFLALAVLMFIPWLRQLFESEWRRSLVRYRYWEWRRNWNRYAMKLGWARQYDRHAHTPTLKDITLDGDKTIVEFQPLADHRISMWSEMADALRRLTNHALATWRETTPGYLQITLHRKPLPSYLPLDFDNIGQEQEIYLGLRADGENLVWDVDYSPHLLVAGATGGGKGSALRLIAVHAITNNWELTIVNPKRSGEFGWTTGNANIVRNLEDTNQLLTDTIREMNQRQDQLDRLGVDTWHDQPWRRQLIIVDETPTLLVGSDQKPLRTEIATQLGRLAAMGRSAGIHLVLVAQRADTQALGQHGGQLRNNVTARIAVGSLDQQGRQMLFGTLDPDIERTLTGIKGRALATQLTDDLTTDIYPAQTAWTEQTQLTRHQKTTSQQRKTKEDDHNNQLDHGTHHHRNHPILLPHPRPHHQNTAAPITHTRAGNSVVRVRRGP